MVCIEVVGSSCGLSVGVVDAPDNSTMLNKSSDKDRCLILNITKEKILSRMLS